MNLAPTASIVVAAYNVECYLDRCVQSLLSQSESAVEVIIVNDGSTDGTASLVAEYVKRDRRVRAVHRRNGGLSAARNTGLEAARGEFVCFVDGDDWVEPNMVESMVGWCTSAGASAAVAGAYVDFHDHDEVLLRSERRVPPHLEIGRDSRLSADDVDQNLVNLIGYAWNKMYRRDFLDSVGVAFEDRLNLIEDIVFNAKVLAAAGRVVFVPDAFTHYIQRPRLTLGTTHDETYLAKRMRAISSQEALLEAWGVDEQARFEFSTHSAGVALWAGLRSVARRKRPAEQLGHMLNSPGAERLMQLAAQDESPTWQTSWATAALRRRRLRLALLPACGLATASRWTHLLKRIVQPTKSPR